MTVAPPIDVYAIHRRYALRWRYNLLFVAGLCLIGSVHFRTVARDHLESKWFRLTSTTAMSQDPQVVQAAQQQLAAYERSWRYRCRHLLRLGPIGLGFVLLIPGIRAGMAARRGVRWARKGRCMGCGYDLRGSGSFNRCPECETPPPPLRQDAPKRWPLRFAMASLPAGGIIMYILLINGFSTGVLLGASGAGKITSAFDEAPCVLVRRARVIDVDGPLQYAFVRETASGLIRQEWWTKRGLDEVIVTLFDSRSERYLPATGVNRQAAANLPVNRRGRHRSFTEVELDILANAPWYRTHALPTDGASRVYRRISRAGLHDHHAREIEIVVIDAATNRPLHAWTGTFREELDANAVPALERVWVTDISYPASAAPQMQRIDESEPGLLRKEFPLYPDWLEEAWVHPVPDRPKQ